MQVDEKGSVRRGEHQRRHPSVKCRCGTINTGNRGKINLPIVRKALPLIFPPAFFLPFPFTVSGVLAQLFNLSRGARCTLLREIRGGDGLPNVCVRRVARLPTVVVHFGRALMVVIGLAGDG
jgi:hypothetical protein